MRPLIFAAGLAAFLLNPGLACVSDDENTFQYGDMEMRAAIEGTWAVTMAFDGGQQKSVTIRLQQASAPAHALGGAALPSPARPARSLVRPAAACVDRTLVKSAGACISSTVMPLVGMFVDGDESYRGVSITGTFRVAGLVFAQGDLSLALGAATRLEAVVSNQGQASSATAVDPAGQDTATIVRTGP
jgi:hypothetical protein